MGCTGVSVYSRDVAHSPHFNFVRASTLDTFAHEVMWSGVTSSRTLVSTSWTHPPLNRV
jgi:hypothetical protein